MDYIADFHIHSRFSRATSPKTNLENIAYWAGIKGVDIISVADFTHPLWFKEIKEKLKEIRPGLYQFKNKSSNVYFILTTEISCIYSQGGKARRLHLIIFAPNLEIVEKINQKLGKSFNLSSDGRPILGISAKELLKIILDISPDCFIVPAHVWTPWYGLFGSKSGFDSLEECFQEESKNIFALETGLSSDVLMNRLWSKLDKYTLISNSDAHSGQNIGREANVFDLEKLSYQNIIKAIKTKKGFKYTIEFFPQEGKYYWDGHRQCNISINPEDLKKNICPKCGQPLTIGVLHRVKDLADRKEPAQLKNSPGFKSLIPLPEIIAQVFNQGKNSKKVQNYYFQTIKKGKNEFNILINLEKEQLEKIAPEIAQAVLLVRDNKIIKKPGYDGVYGEIKIKIPQQRKKQKILF